MKTCQWSALLATTAMVAVMSCSGMKAGEIPAASAPGSNTGDWCDWLQGKPGTLYKNKENPWLQSFQIEGRFQYQLGYLDGSDVNGEDWNETYDEYRRVRLGVKSEFLQYFSTQFVVNLVSDQRNISGGGDLDWGYDSIDVALLGFDIKKAFGAGPLDSLKLNYGRHKFIVGQETRTSSTKLLTVERSAIANKVYGSSRPTGVSMDAAVNKWSLTGALYSSTIDGDDNEQPSGWQDDIIWYGSAGYQVSDGLKLGVDFVYNNADAVNEDSIIGYRWATSFNAEYSAGPWGMIGDVIYGDNGGSGMTSNANRRGDFWGSGHHAVLLDTGRQTANRRSIPIQRRGQGRRDPHQQPLRTRLWYRQRVGCRCQQWSRRPAPFVLRRPQLPSLRPQRQAPGRGGLSDDGYAQGRFRHADLADCVADVLLNIEIKRFPCSERAMNRSPPGWKSN